MLRSTKYYENYICYEYVVARIHGDSVTSLCSCNRLHLQNELHEMLIYTQLGGFALFVNKCLSSLIKRQSLYCFESNIMSGALIIALYLNEKGHV